MADDFFSLQEGETAAPVPAGPVLCEASAAMRRVHRVFLWAYAEAPGLVRSVKEGDHERSAYVGDVLGNFDKLLHVHHEGEDLLMYPKLAARAPACALHVEEMLAQHAAVAERLNDLAPLREQWTRTADPALGEELAAKYEALSELLKVHLRREVTEVTPAVEKVVTPEELEEMASHGVDAFDKKVVLAYLGMILATNPLPEQREFLKDIPLPIRLAYRLVGKGLYRKQYATLFPGREIPQTV
jgi:hypothetical protein